VNYVLLVDPKAIIKSSIMMEPIAASELILDKRGAIYHLGLRPDELAPVVILVGDQDRVPLLSKHFDSIEVKHQHREFITHTGMLDKKRISVVSTGIGPDNVDIAINELDALANIDFETRTIRKDLKRLKIIRVGTSGSLQADIPVDSFVAGTHGLGFDNVMHFYNTPNHEGELAIIEAFKKHTGLTSGNVLPYIFSGDTELLSLFRENYFHGITVGCPGFYGPQGRILRIPLAYEGLINKLTDFRVQGHRISNFEMESSAIYGLGRALGHQCISLNVIVANRVRKEFSKDAAKAVESIITQTLERIAQSEL